MTERFIGSCWWRGKVVVEMLKQMLDRFPSIGCAYVDGAGKVNTEYYGADENTVFPAASMSKFVTALCLMKLHEDRVIDIDTPVNAWLKQWKLRTPDGQESNANLRSIMSHTAGIVDGEDGFYGECAEISLMDILEGRTAYNNRPVRAEKPQGTAFEYSDAGYCVLQLLVEEVTGQTFQKALGEIVFDRLSLESACHAGCPDLAGAGLWITPREMLVLGKTFVESLDGKSGFLRAETAREMSKSVTQFPWTGLGVFVSGEDTLMTQGWSENGQCMMKMNCRTGAVSVVMTNRNPEMDQSESGVEWLCDRNLRSC